MHKKCPWNKTLGSRVKILKNVGVHVHMCILRNLIYHVNTEANRTFMEKDVMHTRGVT